MGARAFCQFLTIAALFTSAAVVHILSCALYDNYWPLIVLVAYALAAIPLCLYARCGSDSAFDSGGGKTAQHWAEFLTTMLLSFVIGLPLVLWHVRVIELGAALMDIAGFLLVLMTGGMCVFFARADSSDSFGGGFGL